MADEFPSPLPFSDNESKYEHTIASPSSSLSSLEFVLLLCLDFVKTSIVISLLSYSLFLFDFHFFLVLRKDEGQGIGWRGMTRLLPSNTPSSRDRYGGVLTLNVNLPLPPDGIEEDP